MRPTEAVNPIKPGTRCECVDEECRACLDRFCSPLYCEREAVCLVVEGENRPALCEPCAASHKQKAASHD